MLSLDLLYLSTDRQFVLFDVAPQSDFIEESHIQQLLARSEYRFYQLNDAGVKDAVEVSNKLTKLVREQAKVTSGAMPGQPQEPGQHSVIIVAKRVAGHVEVAVDKDHMSASATITAPYAGAPVERSDIEAALRQVNATLGHDLLAMKTLLDQASKLPPGGQTQGGVARGLAPQNGADSRFERLVEIASERVLKPQVIAGSQDQVDLRDLGELITVKAGTPLMRRHPPEAGIPGYKVTGEAIPAKAGKELPLHPGKGVDISTQDPDLLIANRDGLPLLIAQGMQVDDVMTIKQVDARFGHINFSGSVIISGNVCEGMRVKADGSVTIGGLVDSASIEAGADVVVANGIIGHPTAAHADSCQVKAGGSILAKFAQYATLEATTGVEILNQLLHCHVRTAGSVRVADSSGLKGSLLGGVIQAGISISTVHLGGSADSSTQLIIRGQFPELNARKEQLHQQLEALQQQFDQLSAAGHKITEMPEGSKRTALMSKLQNMQTQLHEQYHQLKLQQAQVREEREQFLLQAKVEVFKILFEGVKVEIAGQTGSSSRQYGPSVLICRDNKLVIEPLMHKSSDKGHDSKEQDNKGQDPTLLPA